MEAPSDGKGNSEENPDPSLTKKTRKRRSSLEPGTSSEPAIHSSSEESTGAPRNSAQDTLPPVAMEARELTTRSIGSIASAHLSTVESQTSSNTTDSSFQTSFGYERLTQSSSYASIRTIGTPPTGFLSETHIPMDPAASAEDIQSVHRSLQDGLANAMFLNRQQNYQAIYVIAHDYM